MSVERLKSAYLRAPTAEQTETPQPGGADAASPVPDAHTPVRTSNRVPPAERECRRRAAPLLPAEQTAASPAPDALASAVAPPPSRWRGTGAPTPRLRPAERAMSAALDGSSSDTRVTSDERVFPSSQRASRVCEVNILFLLLVICAMDAPLGEAVWRRSAVLFSCGFSQ